MGHLVMDGERFRVVSENPRRASSPSHPRVGSGFEPDGDLGPFREPSSLVCWTHPEWSQRFPWLTQGTSGRSPGSREGDFRVFQEEGPAQENELWMDLAQSNGFSGVFHSRQVHGTEIRVHGEAARGLTISPDADGHASSASGAFLGVTIADCVPVFLVDPNRRAVALLHAGWRGVAAGILEVGISLLFAEFRSSPEEVLLHLGPSICGACYEVGPEVHAALGVPDPGGPAPVDLRAVLAEKAVGMGIMGSHITRSSFCTLCSGSPFFSHRAGESRRQVGFLGIRPT